jgi:hypothetical protein
VRQIVKVRVSETGRKILCFRINYYYKKIIVFKARVFVTDSHFHPNLIFAE